MIHQKPVHIFSLSLVIKNGNLGKEKKMEKNHRRVRKMGKLKRIKTTRSSFLTSASISIPIKASFARANIRTTCVLTVGVYITRFDLALTFVDILKSGKNALYQAKASMNIFIVGHYHPIKQFCGSKLINGTHSCVP